MNYNPYGLYLYAIYALPVTPGSTVFMILMNEMCPLCIIFPVRGNYAA